MPTPAEYLAERISNLEQGLVDPSVREKRYIEDQLAVIRQALGSAAGGGQLGAASVTEGIDDSTQLANILLSLADLRAEVVNSRAISELLVQDSTTPNPRFFIRETNVDQTTGLATVGILNLDASTPSPVPVLPLTPAVATALSIQEHKYVGQVAGVGYAVGDSIAHILLLGSSGAILGSSWYNVTTNTVLATIPTIGNLKGYEDRLEELLTTLVARIPASLGLKTAANSFPVSLATDQVLSLPTGLALESRQTAANILLQSIVDLVGLPNIRPLTSASDTVNIVPPATMATALNQDLIKGLLQDIVNRVGIPNIRALTAADVVTTIVQSLPGTVAADIAAIRTNTGRISQYQFHLAQTSAGVVFLVRTDNATGASININIATGATITPGSVEMSDPTPVSSSLSVELNEFEAITTNGANWTIGDLLTRILVINANTSAVVSTIWQSATGATLGVIPVLGTDAIDTDKQILTLARALNVLATAISAKLPAALGAQTLAQSLSIALASDQVLPLPQGAATEASLTNGNQKTQIVAGTKTFYSATVNLTSPANATDVFGLRGSSTKKVSIMRINLTLRGSTMGRQFIDFLRRSSANTGGTPSNVAALAFDPLNPTATAQAISYTTNPTAVGALVGVFMSTSRIAPAATSLIDDSQFPINFFDAMMQPIVLRGVNDFFWINFRGASAANIVTTANIEWVEE